MLVKRFDDFRQIIEESENKGLFQKAIGLSGFSGEKLIGALQRLSSYQAERGAGCYLEIGVFQGLTLLSVAKVIGDSMAYGIDNFSLFDEDGTNRNIIERRMAENDIRNAFLLEMDYEDALEALGDHITEKIGVFFVDGPHDYRSQLMCLQLAAPFLSETAVIIVDDSNYRHVRQANKDFLICNPDFKLLFETYTKCHPDNLPESEMEKAQKGWWNGVNILVRDPEDSLDKLFPPTSRDRTIFENEHILHGMKYYNMAPHALEVVGRIIDSGRKHFFKEVRSILRKARKMDASLIGDYPILNTYSDQLPRNHFNPAIRENK